MSLLIGAHRTMLVFATWT